MASPESGGNFPPAGEENAAQKIYEPLSLLDVNSVQHGLPFPVKVRGRSQAVLAQVSIVAILSLIRRFQPSNCCHLVVGLFFLWRLVGRRCQNVDQLLRFFRHSHALAVNNLLSVAHLFPVEILVRVAVRPQRGAG